jgi:hypothetical protein
MEFPQLSPAPLYKEPERLRPDPGTRGFTVDLSAVAAAQEATKINAEGFVKQAGAGAYIGKALQNVAEAGVKLAKEHFDSVNRGRILDAEASLNAASRDIAVRVAQHPDKTLEWAAITEDETARREQQILSDKTYSPFAREQIERMVSRWKIQTVSEIRHQAARVAFDREARKLEGRLMEAYERKDFAVAGQTIDLMSGPGLFRKETIAGKKKELQYRREMASAEDDNMQVKAAVELARATAKVDPGGAAEKVSAADFGNDIKPETAALIRVAVRQEQAAAFHSAHQDALQAMAAAQQPGAGESTASVLTGADLARLAGNRLYPSETRRLQETLAAFREAVPPPPDKVKELYGQSLTRLWAYDRERLGGAGGEAARQEYAEILAGTLPLPAELRQEITAPLGAKWLAAVPVPDASHRDFFERSLQELFESDAFGRKNMTISTEDGAIHKTVPNTAGLKEAHIALGEAMLALRTWERDHPRATRDEARTALYEVSRETLARQDAARILDPYDFPEFPAGEDSLNA